MDDLFSRDTNCRGRFVASVTTIRRERVDEGKVLDSSRDKNKGAYRGQEGGEEPAW